jgi:hypothetical protein
MTDLELMDKAWDYLASYTVGERPNASEVNDLVFALERRLAQPEHELVIDCPRCGHCCPKPNQEPWVGLTDEEIGVPTEPIQPNEAIMFARVIEALIKGKNT